MAEILADDMCNDDRRRVVNAGVRHGRDTDIEHMRAIADVGAKTITSTVIATRGERLVLRRVLFSGEDQVPEAFQAELLDIVEIDADERIVARVSFDARRHRRRLRGARRPIRRRRSGRPRAHVVGHRADYAALNRRRIPRDDAGLGEHRPPSGDSRSTPGDLTAYIRATWDLAPDFSIYIEAVHRLSDLGAVVTQAAHGTSQEGFDAEWRDDRSLDGRRRPDQPLRAIRRGRPRRRARDVSTSSADRRRGWKTRQAECTSASEAHFAARDWDAMAEMLADDMCNDDRRRVVNAGLRHGRDIEIANTRAFAELGVTNVTSDVIATRGDRLALGRNRFIGARPAA